MSPYQYTRTTTNNCKQPVATNNSHTHTADTHASAQAATRTRDMGRPTLCGPGYRCLDDMLYEACNQCVAHAQVMACKFVAAVVLECVNNARKVSQQLSCPKIFRQPCCNIEGLRGLGELLNRPTCRRSQLEAKSQQWQRMPFTNTATVTNYNTNSNLGKHWTPVTPTNSRKQSHTTTNPHTID